MDAQTLGYCIPYSKRGVIGICNSESTCKFKIFKCIENNTSEYHWQGHSFQSMNTEHTFNWHVTTIIRLHKTSTFTKCV